MKKLDKQLAQRRRDSTQHHAALNKVHERVHKTFSEKTEQLAGTISGGRQAQVAATMAVARAATPPIAECEEHDDGNGDSGISFV